MTNSSDPRGQMVHIAHLMFTRFLTNSAGGNVSCRVGERIYVTPRYLGSKYHWQLKEEMVLIFDGDFAAGEFNCIQGDPAQVSRESRMHFACYQHFPEINGVIHAHPMNLNVFASMGKPVTPTNQYTEKFGEMSVVPNLPAHSQDLADSVVEALTPRRDTLQKNGLGLILNWHGVVTVGRDLLDAYDTLERLEWSAYALLHRNDM
ncbi:MAG: class II aldolase/adducin family protein [Caldilineaceae bacterium]|nr:class II aldolase/adducin family protein [Caldilineaceae bacterium]